MLHHLAQVFLRILHIAYVEVVVSVCIVPFLLRTPVYGIALHIADYVLCIVYPVLLYIAFCKPCTSLTIDSRLCLVETAHICESGGSLVEVTLVEL